VKTATALGNFLRSGALWALFPAALSAAEDGAAFFEAKVRPVLIKHCHECHSADAKKVKGGLLLDTRAGWQRGGDSGLPAVVPGNPDESPLIRAVRHVEEDFAMPPRQPKLPDAVIADLVAWVRMGAPDPRDGNSGEARRADKSWWSLQPVAREFRHRTIDGFVDEALAAKGLARNPPADARTLIRRMTYDLTGLPPTPAEVAEFAVAHAADPDAAAAALADRLLASPRYGERWGRHWLDVVRFGESNGFERNFIIDDLWPFRDWVIRSLNDDKPFDRFITEHLAGDVIGKNRPEIEVGSAFLVAGPYDDVGNQDPVAKANIRAATIDDMIVTTGGAFLGLTVGCARCHHHKFDPMPTEDYYRLRAAFEGVTHGRREVATVEQRAAFADATKPLNKRLAEINAAVDRIERAVAVRAKELLKTRTFPRPKIDPELTEETFTPVEARFVRFTVLDNTEAPGRPPPRVNNRRATRAGGRLTEFEVWTTDGRNVALAASGGRAEGARGAVAEDFPEAYGPQLCIDGRHGEQWFIGNPAELTITLARPEMIDRVTFSNAKGRGLMDKAQGATPCEYEVKISTDGNEWRTVATSFDRMPWSERHALERVRGEVIMPEEEKELAALERERGQVQAALNKVPKLPQMWAGKFDQPAERTFVHKGGEPMKPGEVVRPASLEILSQVTPAFALAEDAPEGARRLALARWITAPENPLTPRVLANRIWQHHFGTGIVDTPSDFGFQGGRPSHPELLDFLATRLMAHGWRLKPLHREIVLSRAYRQSGAFREDGGRADRDARLLWRFPPRRLSAEEVRDTMLVTAGRLRLEPMGGPGFRLYKYTQNNVSTYFPLDAHGPETHRRAVYHQNARASVVDVLTDFDLPDIAFAAPRRANTTTPLQALTLLNHRFTFDLAAALAERIAGSDPVGAAYSIAFQRVPGAEERAAGEAFIARHGAAAFSRAILNANELLYLD
jgi:mono/diheme cytochrome c family protein